MSKSKLDSFKSQDIFWLKVEGLPSFYFKDVDDIASTSLLKEYGSVDRVIWCDDMRTEAFVEMRGSNKTMKETTTEFLNRKVSIKPAIPTPTQLKNIEYRGENIVSIPERRQAVSTSSTLKSWQPTSHPDAVAKSLSLPLPMTGLPSYEDMYGEDSDEDRKTAPESPLESLDNSTMPPSTYSSKISESTELVSDSLYSETSLSTMTDMSTLTPTTFVSTNTEVEQSLPSSFSLTTIELDESMTSLIQHASHHPGHSHSRSPHSLKHRTVKVEGVQADWDETILKIAFTDKEKGGGKLETGGIKMEGSVAHIKFRDSHVAKRVAIREKWKVMGTQVLVSLMEDGENSDSDQEDFDPNKTVIIDGIPDDMTDKHLFDNLRLATGVKEAKFTVQRRRSRALFRLIGKYKQGSAQKLVKYIQNRTKLKASVLPEPEGIVLRKVQSNKCTKEFINMYFNNRYMSGGREVENVTILPNEEVIVTFRNAEVAKTCSQRHHSESLGSEVQVNLYYSVLEPWILTESGESGNQDPPVMSISHNKLSFPITHNLSKFLQRANLTTTFTPLDDLNRLKLADLQARAIILPDCGESLEIHPLNNSRYSEQWAQECTGSVSAFLDQFSEISVDCPSDVTGPVLEIVKKQRSTKRVMPNLSADASDIVLVGYKEDVTSLQQCIEGIVRENHQKSVTRTFPQTTVAYIDAFWGRDMEARYQVKFSVNFRRRTIEVQGTDQNCQAFLSIVGTLRPPTKHVQMSPLQCRLLSSREGLRVFSEILSVKHCQVNFFTTEQEVVLVAKEDRHLDVASEILQVSFPVSVLRVPHNLTDVSQTSGWTSLVKDVESKYVAAVDEDQRSSEVHVAYYREHGEALEMIKSFLKKWCSISVLIPLQPAHWRYLTHSQVWKEISEGLNALDLCILPTDEDTDPQIVLTGDPETVQALKAKVTLICDRISSQEVVIDQPGVVSYLSSELSHYRLKQIEQTQDALIEWRILPNRPTPVSQVVESLPGYQQAKLLCTCTIAKGVTLKVKVGDLTVYPADVLVNCTSSDLQLSSGLSAVFKANGGDILQEDCSQYIAKHGHLQSGEAIMFKHTGSLPAKAIVHTVGPKNESGNEEEVLSRAVYNSLVKTEGHVTVAFPAISTGANKVPGSVSAKGMLRGFRKFFEEHPNSSMKDIAILLDDEAFIIDFIPAAISYCSEVMVPIKGQDELNGNQASQHRRPSVRKTKDKPDKASLTIISTDEKRGISVEVVTGDPNGDNSAGCIVTGDPRNSNSSSGHQSLGPERVIVEQIRKKAVFFVDQPTTHDECERIVGIALQKAEKEGLKSVTVPDRLAKRCFPLSEGLTAITRGVDRFLALNIHKNLKTIRIFVSEWDTGINRSEMSEAVSLQVYGCGQEAAKHALAEVQAVIATGCCTEKVASPIIATISPSTVEGLRHRAEDYGVQILISKSDSSISISGMCESVRAMKTIVEVEVDRLAASGRVISKVKWQWKDKDGVYRDYSMGTSDTIEAIYQKEEPFLFVNTEDGQKFIHFEKMTESSESSITFVRRHDLELEGDIPSTWDHFSYDVPFHCVLLERDSQEFLKVAVHFASNVPCTDSGGVAYGKIKSIERVQNRTAWRRYQLELERKKQDPTHHPDQVLQHDLFHGCNVNNIDNINKGNFSTSEQGFGKGINFSKDSKEVFRQAPPDADGCKHIYLCKVMTGDFTKGARSTMEPPRKDKNRPDRYDSVTNKVKDPTVFVVFKDAQVYPEYHIVYSP